MFAKYFWELIVVSSLLLVVPTPAFPQGYSFDDPNHWSYFTTESGLPSNAIRDIIEADDSTLWVIAGSPVWYDGFEWRKVDSADSQFLNSSLGFHRADNNCVLVKASPAGSGYKVFKLNKSGYEEIITGLDNFDVYSLSSGKMLLVSDNSLFSYDHGSVLPFTPHDNLTREQVLYAQNTVSGAMLLNLKTGLYRMDNRSFNLMIPAGRFSLNVMLVAENRNGEGIIQFETPYEMRGVWEWNASSLPKRSTTEHFPFAQAMDIGPHGEAIIVYRTGEIRWREHGVWKSLPSVESRIHDITVVKFRANGDLVFGTMNGLYVYRYSMSPWKMITYPIFDSRNTVHDIIMAKDGSFWIASSGGIERRQPNGTVTFWENIGNTTIHNVTGLQEDAEGSIWIGSGFSFMGAFRFDGRSWNHVTIGTPDDSVLVHKIRKDLQGNLWFLGLGKNAQDKKQPGTLCFHEGSFSKWGVEEGLINGRVYDFVEGQDGALWFATFGGISRWIPSVEHSTASASKDRSGISSTVQRVRNGTWTHWTIAKGLKENRITSIVVDKENSVWFGSNYPPGPYQSIGIGRIDSLGDVQYFNSIEGTIGDNIWDINIDSTGRVWYTTTEGLGCYDHGTWLRYGRESGLSFVNLWPVLPEGNTIYVGTKGRGIAMLNLTAATSPLPKIVMEHPYIEEFSAHQGWKALTYWGELDPLNVQTRYRVNNGEWSKWRIKNGVVLSNMKPGDYTFEVQAKNLYGAFRIAGEKTVFTIPQPWYYNGYFISSVFAGVIAFIFVITSAIIRKRKFDIAIRESEERYRIITEFATDYAYLNRIEEDGSWTILWITESVTRVYGYTVEEWRSPGFHSRLVHPEDLEEGFKIMQSVIRGESASYDTRCIAKDGSVLWIHNEMRPVWNTEHTRVEYVYGAAHDITQKKLDEEHKKHLTTELVQTEERERRRMAVYLHDIIGQHLAVGKITLREVLKSGIAGEMEEQLAEVGRNLDNAIKDSRSLTFELSPPVLQDVRFDIAVKMLAEQMMTAHHIGLTIECNEIEVSLEPQIKVLLYYAVREILFNIIKHASASEVKFIISCTDTEIRMSIEDNGIGFDKDEALSNKFTASGFGLKNVSERMGHIGAQIDIISIPQQGTRVAIYIPINKLNNGFQR
ncbi:MAG: PAS domain-containing protein [Ignavibacteriales bacterium]|nr:PAS domain-containing protein [Ignavibacteriales bacterium]